jgi:hypothetical protein
MSDPLKPSPALLAKLGSIVVHVDEGFSTKGHAFDIAAMQALIDDDEVQHWLGQMSDFALVPLKRTAKRR